MIIGIGLDLAETSRIKAAVAAHGDRFLQRIYTPDELDYCQGAACPELRLAGHFAAKEACAKALGVGIGARAGWRDMEVTRDAAGQPTIRLTGAAGQQAGTLGVGNVFLSITHTGDHAAAVVVLEG